MLMFPHLSTMKWWHQMPWYSFFGCWVLKPVMLEKEMATHSSILAWKTPQMEEPGRLQSMAEWLHFTFSWGLLMSETGAEGRWLIGWRGWWVKTEGCWEVWSYELPSSAWLAWNAEGPRAGQSQRPKWPTPGATKFGNWQMLSEKNKT